MEWQPTPVFLGFPGGSADFKESTCSAGDLGLIPGLERSPGEGHGSPLQYCCLENPMHRGAWRATVHGVAELVTTERLTLSCVPSPCCAPRMERQTCAQPGLWRAKGFHLLCQLQQLVLVSWNAVLRRALRKEGLPEMAGGSGILADAG